MNRRTFLSAVVAGAVIGLPNSIGAQLAAAGRIGFVANSPRTPITDAFWDAFVAGLQEHGWAESRNLAIERRYVTVGTDAAVAAADELVRRGLEVIVVASTQIALAAKRTTTTVPIVMTIPADPVAVGLVERLSRPGGNVTGLSFVGTEMSAKQLELLHAAVANLTSIAVLANPKTAKALGLTIPPAVLLQADRVIE